MQLSIDHARVFAGVALAACLLFVLSACSRGQDGEAAQVDGYAVRVATDPDPLLVGEEATLFFTLGTVQQQAPSDCQVDFRQYMPGMEMSRDGVYVPMRPVGEGRFEGRTAQFTMGGDWALEFRFTCGGEPHRFVLQRHLEWRE